MTRIKILNKTPLKSRAIPFIELNTKYIHWLNKDVEIIADVIKEKENHLEIKLLTTDIQNLPIGIKVWYLYKEHIQVFDEPGIKKVKGRTILTTDYYYQLDNQYEPYTSCFLTCVAMLLSFYKIEVTPDELYNTCISLGYDRFSHQDIVAIVKSYGVNYYATTSGTFKELKKALETAPIIIGTYLTEGSHIVLAVGFDDSAYDGRGAIIVNDPYGEFTHEGYIHTSTAGKETLYSYSLIAQVAAPEGDGNYWLHLPE